MSIRSRSRHIFNWKAKYGGMTAAEIKRLRELEEENAKLKRMYADVSLEVRALKDLFEKKGWELPSGVKR